LINDIILSEYRQASAEFVRMMTSKFSRRGAGCFVAQPQTHNKNVYHFLVRLEMSLFSREVPTIEAQAERVIQTGSHMLVQGTVICSSRSEVIRQSAWRMKRSPRPRNQGQRVEPKQ
jgi:hypothetical protein